jgi:plastocyanin
MIRLAVIVAASVTIGLMLQPAGTAAQEQASAPFVVPEGEDGVQRATVELDSYSFTPDHLVVQAGKPVELTLVSVTGITPHDFVIDDPASGLDIDVDVGGGKTRTVTFTPAQTGTFVFYCSKDLPFMASHREKGMEGRLEVR